MLLHLLETGRHHALHAGSALGSASAHAAVVVSVVVGAWATQSPARAPEPPVEREAVFLLPTLPSRPTREVEPAPTTSASAPRDAGRRAVAEGVLPAGSDDADGEVARRALHAMSARLDSLQRNGNLVYRVTTIEQPVERDPLSAAPLYPLELQQRRIEGDVSAEWIVDARGRADTATFRVLEASHPRFAEAVRAALPLMHFRSAELFGRPVRQRVQQSFAFRLTFAGTRDSASSGARAP